MEVIYNMKQINQCMECGESVTNPICPECIMAEAMACLADRYMAGKLAEWEINEINERLAKILKASYSEEGIDCIKCRGPVSVCPHCTARYFKDILPRNLAYFLFCLKNYTAFFGTPEIC